MTTTTSTPTKHSLTIGPGRAAGYALGRFAWEGGILPRATLNVLIPAEVRQRVSDPGQRLRQWLKLTESRGHIKVGVHLIKVMPGSVDHLVYEATRDLGRHTSEPDYVDLGQAKLLLSRVIIPAMDDSPLKARIIRELLLLNSIQ
jgi:hypothetical protein